MGQTKSTVSGMNVSVRELHVAVMKNDVPTVVHLVQNGTDVDFPWTNADFPSVKDGCTPLCEAVSLNHRQIVEILIQARASLHKADRFGCTPLHKAAYHGRHNLAAMLIHAGANVNAADSALNTPLHVCVQNFLVHNNIDIVHVLLHAEARVDATNIYGQLPLHYAVRLCARDVTKILIKAGAHIDWTDNMLETPLYSCVRDIEKYQQKQAVFQQHLPAIKVLIMAGCDTLNLATWIRKNRVLSSNCRMDEDIYSWYVSSQPECLKHLCRVTIQRHLKCSKSHMAFYLRYLPLPIVLIEYLKRQLF